MLAIEGGEKVRSEPFPARHLFGEMMAEREANDRLRAEDLAAFEAKIEDARAAAHVQVLPLRRDLHASRATATTPTHGARHPTRRSRYTKQTSRSP